VYEFPDMQYIFVVVVYQNRFCFEISYLCFHVNIQ